MKRYDHGGEQYNLSNDGSGEGWPVDCVGYGTGNYLTAGSSCATGHLDVKSGLEDETGFGDGNAAGHSSHGKDGFS